MRALLEAYLTTNIATVWPELSVNPKKFASPTWKTQTSNALATTMTQYQVTAYTASTDFNKAVIAAKDEPGERLVLKGTLYGADGSTPLPNVSIYAYQTDATGVYSRPVDDSRNPRLKAWARTDAQGRFEFDTIKTGSYPGGGNPAHIHVVMFQG